MPERRDRWFIEPSWAAIVLAVAAVIVGGCGQDGGSRHARAAAPSSSAGSGAAGAGARTGRWYAGDFHVHTTHSRDARAQGGDDVATSLRLAESAGLDFVAITDHNNRSHATDPGFASNRLVLLSGEEWGGSSHAGAIGSVTDLAGLDESQPPTTWNLQVQQAIDQTHAEGGIFVVNHPTGFNFWLWTPLGFDAVEIWNGYWSFYHEVRLFPVAVDALLLNKGMLQAGVDVSDELKAAVQARGGQNDQALAFWEEHLARGRMIPAVGGGDRHMIVMPGRPTTYVWADDATPAAILAGVRAGRTVVASRTGGPWADFRADADGNGTFESMVGDVVPTGRTVRFQVEVTNAAGGRLVIVRDGHTLLSQPVRGVFDIVDFVDVPAGPAWYRADVFTPVLPSIPWPVTGSLAPFLGTTLDALQIVALSAGLVSPIPTYLPTVDPPEAYERYLHRDLLDPDWSRAVVTSPIYAR